MSPAEIRNSSNVGAFQPVVVLLADGSSHRAGNPNEALVVRGTLYIGFAHAVDGIPTRTKHINRRQITPIEPNPADAA